MTDSIYLDHNATSPMLPEVADAVREASLRYCGNPGSQHAAGREARRALEESREKIGYMLGARVGGRPADRVIFTSGGTEANNLALFGLLNAVSRREPGLLITSAIEHPSILEPASQLKSQGWQVTHIDTDQHGVANVVQFEQSLRPETRLVSLMLGNNETGVLQPVAEVAELCQSRGVPLHTDAAQVVGKLAVNFADLKVAMLSCAAHKFNGPLGVGALIVQHGVSLRPTGYGGHQQAGLRPGTETVALAIGMGTALECFHREVEQRQQRLTHLRDELERQLLAEMPSAIVVGRGAERLPNTSNIAFVGLDRQALVMALDLAGVACSTGSACASGSSEPSPALAAMGLSNDAIRGAIRLSLGVTTTAAEMAEATRRIINVCQGLRNRPNH